MNSKFTDIVLQRIQQLRFTTLYTSNSLLVKAWNHGLRKNQSSSRDHYEYHSPNCSSSPPLHPSSCLHCVVLLLQPIIWQTSTSLSWSPAEHVFDILSVLLYFGLFSQLSIPCSFLLNPSLFLKNYRQKTTVKSNNKLEPS